MAAIPCLMSGRDVLAVAETGSGKTLSYVLPLALFLKCQLPTLPGQGPLAIMIAPTRELVEQIYGLVNKILSKITIEHTITTSCTKFRCLGICGGVPIAGQTKILSQGIDVLVATPGRLLDLISRSKIPLDRLHYLVFDEVDHMLSDNSVQLDVGGKNSLGSMENQLRIFLGQCNLCPRQTCLFSATVPPSVERLARSALLNEIYITVGQTWGKEMEEATGGMASSGGVASSCGGLSLIPPNITQNVIFVHTYQKKMKLLSVLRSTPSPPVLIFCDSIPTVDKIVIFLKSEQFHAAGIHGEKSQGYRFRVMDAFKKGQLDVLVTTDLSSRGLDFDFITHVILYDMPNKIETYIHRVGRTGRAGGVGVATTLLTYHCKCAKQLKFLLKMNNQEIPEQLNSKFRFFGRNVISTDLGDRVVD
eukprot:TRINITY_DN11205_c0_g1_i3.p1 TRINITY_DN11205_c0_g1~~TRINITY_DN11205_c0_g1_i3.p1  ORF type:complete len:419 (-),score=94.36 TRINITY_DN11205_c0_g1_i3:107-1363(-)